MTNFEMNGMRKQYEAKTKAEAEAQFNASCERCCTTGRCWKSCVTCCISAAHDNVMNVFELEELNKTINKSMAETKKRMGL